jgi:hypothetical protein
MFLAGAAQQAVPHPCLAQGQQGNWNCQRAGHEITPTWPRHKNLAAVGLVLEIIGLVFMLSEARTFRNYLAMDQWIAKTFSKPNCPTMRRTTVSF